MIDPRSEEACALALRVETAIKKLDARLAEREEWRDAVAEWRHCVQLFGPGSASAKGALVEVVGEAWGSSVMISEQSADWSVTGRRASAIVYRRSFAGASLFDVLVFAVESAP